MDSNQNLVQDQAHQVLKQHRQISLAEPGDVWLAHFVQFALYGEKRLEHFDKISSFLFHKIK